MAIVKFISDKNCKLYIDMDFVGEVQVDNMLKISLGTGSYLIEAKDANDKILKKYELNVNSNDNQVLQDLAITSTAIHESLEKAKNDSSIQFHNNRAIFCHNGCYGYINNAYKIAISPIYTFASNFVSSKAFVRRLFPEGEKASLIDIDGNMYLNQWYDYVGGNDKTILLHSDDIFYVLSRKDYSFIEEYHNAKYNGKVDLIPVCKESGVDEMYGYIDKSGTEVIPFIYDYAWNFDENGFAQVKRFGNVYVVDKTGTLYYNYYDASNDGKEFYHEPLPFGDPNDIGYTEIYHAHKLSKEDSKNLSLVLDSGFTPIKKGKTWYLYYSGPDEYLEVDNKIVKCDRIFYSDDYCHAYRSNGICKLLIYNENIIHSFDADEIIVNIKTALEGYAGHDEVSINNVIIKKNKKYGIEDLNGKIILPIEYDLIEPTEAIQGNVIGNVGIIWKEGKCSFVWMSNGDILEPFKYEDIIVNKNDGKTWLMFSTYLVKENGKYGCIDFDRKQILPPIYDSIDFNLEIDVYGYYHKMLLCKDEKYGTYEYRNYRSELTNNNVIEIVFSVEPEYDECVFLRNEKAVTSFAGMSYVAVKKNNKWGIIDNDANGSYYYYDYENYYKYGNQWKNSPNLKDLDFKYNTLEELKEDADKEFERRIKQKKW